MAPGSRGSGGLSRRAALALIGGGGLLSVSASGAFDRVDANRPFELEVDDENALLGIETFTPIDVDSSPETVDLLELTNRFSDATLTEVSVSSDDAILSVEDLAGLTLQAGESETVSGTVTVNESGQWTVTLTITVTTASERIEATRTVTIDSTIAGYEPGTCPVSVPVGPDALPEQESAGSISVTNQAVAGGIDAGGSVTVTGNGDDRVIIDGSIEAGGAVDITTNGRVDTIIISGGIDADGPVTIEANSGSITIGGDVEGAQLTITANGNGSVTICGDAEPDDVTIRGNDASVNIDGEAVEDETGNGNDNRNGNGNDEEDDD